MRYAARTRSVTKPTDDVADLHERYLEAVSATGKRGGIALERFRAAVVGQQRALEERGSTVEGFDIVIENGSVKVRARVRRGKEGE